MTRNRILRPSADPRSRLDSATLALPNHRRHYHDNLYAMTQHVAPSYSLRREDAALLRGEGQFVNDLIPAGGWHLAFARSSVAHATIHSINTEAAREYPGVKAVFTATDIPTTARLPINPVIAPRFQPDWPLLASQTIEAVGQAYAAVVADSPGAAAEACELIEVDLVALPVELPLSASPDRCVFRDQWTDDQFDAVFDSAPVHVSTAVQHPRLAPTPLETRSIFAHANRGAMDVWLSTQTPHRAREHLATILGIEEQTIRLHSVDVGGAFGMKASLYPEEVVVVWAAQHLDAAISWQASRHEDMLTATHGRGTRAEGTLALDRTGRFLALRAEIECPLGYWLPNSAAIPAWNAARILPGPYSVDAVQLDTCASLSNTAAVGIYRGAGRPEAAMLMERLIDKAARQLNCDPVQLRQQNLIEKHRLPYRQCSGARLDTGDYAAGLAQLCEFAQLPALRQSVQRRRARGELVGLGIACFVEPCGSGWESARLSRQTNGSLIAHIGGSTQGHGRETAYASLLSQEFDLPIESIDIRHGDTATCPSGIGALASRSTAIGGSTLLAAARELKTRLHSAQPDGQIDVDTVYHGAHEAWGAGFFLAQIRIDADTGRLAVEDIFCIDETGRVIAPVLSDGQLHGGLAQGLGEAVMEEMHYDGAGQLLTASLLDYAVPRALDMPRIRTARQHPEVAQTDANLLGAKGIGESGTIGAPAAIVNAAIDALAHLGISELPMPLTSERLWRAIHHKSPLDN